MKRTQREDQACHLINNQGETNRRGSRSPQNQEGHQKNGYHWTGDYHQRRSHQIELGIARTQKGTMSGIMIAVTGTETGTEVGL